MKPKTRITEIAEECAYVLGKEAVNGAGRYLQDKAVGLIETALNAAADDERARVVALLEAAVQAAIADFDVTTVAIIQDLAESMGFDLRKEAS
jgi:predicted DsbA family dithiol-disulfide isomerase